MMMPTHAPQPEERSPFEKDGVYTHETRRLVEAGMAVEPDSVWSYKQMNDLLQRPVDGADGALQHALRILARDHGREFRNIRKHGYLRLTDEGIVHEGGNDRSAVSRKIKRAVMRTTNIQNWNALNTALQRDVDAHRSILHLMRHLVKPSSVNRVRSEVDRAHAELDLDQTLRLFRNDTRA
jgi:hypothetical protein